MLEDQTEIDGVESFTILQKRARPPGTAQSIPWVFTVLVTRERFK